jgi:transposase InsO family protein
MDQKQRFISLAKSGHFTFTELCKEFEISRKTGYKWLNRERKHGTAGLAERGSAPLTSPQRTSDSIERLILAEKRAHLTWGPKKLHQRLKTVHEIEKPPARSTIGEILKRHGLTKRRRVRGGVFKVERGHVTEAKRPNHVWAADFKGWFYLGNGEKCDALTISDLHSRYLIRIDALPQATVKWTRRAFRNAFKQYGLPEIIHVDNGTPFGSMGPGGLSKLSVWLMSLGVEIEFSRPGHPQDNGCHERMHRTMKEDCCQPASVNNRAQQQRFDRWKKTFNEERPHEALELRLPCELYHPSSKRLSEQLKLPLYQPSELTRKVCGVGNVSIHGKRCWVGEAFVNAKVAIEEYEPDKWLVRFGNVKLGWVDVASPDARLRPTAYAERLEMRPCAAA